MAKPKEVLISIDEDGDVEEEVYVDTETLALYDTMRETLIYLTNHDTKKMDELIQSRLDMMKEANKHGQIGHGSKTSAKLFVRISDGALHDGVVAWHLGFENVPSCRIPTP